MAPIQNRQEAAAWQQKYDPETIEERRSAPGDCVEALLSGSKTSGGEINDRVNQAYPAWSTRLYLLDKNGLIVSTRGSGPFGFKPAELKRAIQNHLLQEAI